MARRSSTAEAPGITLAPDALMVAGSTFFTGNSMIEAGTRARWSDACVQTRPGAWNPVDATDDEIEAHHHTLRQGLRPLTTEPEPDTSPKFLQAKERVELVFVDPLLFLEGAPLGPMSRQVVEAGEVNRGIASGAAEREIPALLQTGRRRGRMSLRRATGDIRAKAPLAPPSPAAAR